MLTLGRLFCFLRLFERFLFDFLVPTTELLLVAGGGGVFCLTPSESDTSSLSLMVRLGLRLMFGKGTVTYEVTVQRGQGRAVKETAVRQAG